MRSEMQTITKVHVGLTHCSRPTNYFGLMI